MFSQAMQLSGSDRWRAAQLEVEAALADISGALGVAGQHYAETELTAASLFR